MKFVEAKNYIVKRLERELPENVYYHDINHARDVLKISEKIAAAEGITGDKILIIKTAAIYHDAGFMVKYRNNEPEACKIARKSLPQFDYNPEEIEEICRLIMATAYPTNPQDLMEEIICDADLNYLGTDNFFRDADNLRRELHTHNRNFTDAEWLKCEIEFLRNQNFYTETARKIYAPVKQQHLETLLNKKISR